MKSKTYSTAIEAWEAIADAESAEEMGALCDEWLRLEYEERVQRDLVGSDNAMKAESAFCYDDEDFYDDFYSDCETGDESMESLMDGFSQLQKAIDKTNRAFAVVFKLFDELGEIYDAAGIVEPEVCKRLREAREAREAAAKQS